MTNLILIEGPENSGKTSIAWKVYDELMSSASKVTYWAMDEKERPLGHEIRILDGVLQDFYAQLEIRGKNVYIASAGDYGYKVRDSKKYADQIDADIVILGARYPSRGDIIQRRLYQYWNQNPQYIIKTEKKNTEQELDRYLENRKDRVIATINELINMTKEVHMVRTFWPIGHGAFYTEKWMANNKPFFNVVFDCGSGNTSESSENSVLHNNIQDAFTEKEKVDAVFISHLHNDHVNGLKKLLERADVKRLYFPQLTIERVVETIMYAKISETGDIPFSDKIELVTSLYNNRDFYRDVPVEYIPEATEPNDSYEEHFDIIHESPSIGDGEDDIHQIEIRKGVSGILSLIPINRFRNKNFGVISWVYMPFNPKMKKSVLNEPEIKIFISDKEDGKKELDIIGFTEFVKYTPIDTIKDIYRRIYEGGHNSYSMTLYSGYAHPRFICHFVPLHHCYYRGIYYPSLCNICSSNCLYTGDFEPNRNSNMQDIENYYEKDNKWTSIGMIQVPHHGSDDNFNTRLYQRGGKICIISSNTKRTYGHPSKDVVNKIQEAKCLPIIVTEQQDTVQKFTYYPFCI